MLVFYQLPHVFPMFSNVFWAFSRTNQLTQCLEPVPVFCCLFVSEKLYMKYSRKVLKIHGGMFFPGTKKGSKRQHLEGWDPTR